MISAKKSPFLCSFLRTISQNYVSGRLEQFALLYGTIHIDVYWFFMQMAQTIIIVIFTGRGCPFSRCVLAGSSEDFPLFYN
jgi:hypothetical protein